MYGGAGRLTAQHGGFRPGQCDTQCGAGISAECMACRQCCSADEYCAGPGFSNFYCARYNYGRIFVISEEEVSILLENLV